MSIRFESPLFGLSEGGVPQGSPEAKAAIARVAKIMAPKKRTKKDSAMPANVTPITADQPLLEEEWTDGEMTSRVTVMRDRSGYLTVENDEGDLDPRTRRMKRDDWIRLGSLCERAVAKLDRLEDAA